MAFHCVFIERGKTRSFINFGFFQYDTSDTTSKERVRKKETTENSDYHTFRQKSIKRNGKEPKYRYKHKWKRPTSNYHYVRIHKDPNESRWMLESQGSLWILKILRRVPRIFFLVSKAQGIRRVLKNSRCMFKKCFYRVLLSALVLQNHNEYLNISKESLRIPK